jgi:arylformamidase
MPAMTVIDLSHPISPAMPVYPGTEPPVIRQANTLARDGFAEKLISLYSHTGTHMDAPAHMVNGGQTLDSMEASRFVGPGCVVDVATEGRVSIGIEDLEPRRAAIERSSFVLFRTGWERLWGMPGYFTGFPALTLEAARWLAARRLVGVGFDAISADPIEPGAFPNHLVFFGAGMVIVENLRGLAALGSRDFLFCCLPLPIDESDGSPVRAAAIIL